MDDTLDRLEKLLDLMAKPDQIEEGRLSGLTEEWEGVVQLLLLESQIKTNRMTDKVRWQERLEGLLQRLPDIQSGLTAYQSDVAEQLYAENRRLQSLRQIRKELHVHQEPLIRCRA